MPTTKPRQNFTRSARRAAWERSQGSCDNCGASLDPKAWEHDHVLACGLGGDASFENGQALCRRCHLVKSRADLAMIRKADRQRKAHETGRGRARKGRPLQSRGFTGWRNFRGEPVRAG